ncbi:MAG: carboxypeptidase regulatory-like domain-containing protein [Isosphaerales bacterium]
MTPCGKKWEHWVDSGQYERGITEFPRGSSHVGAARRCSEVLCDLEGRSYAEAARRLRCPLGTVQSRLARGRERLRARLVRRGLAPAAVSALLAEGATASVPEVLAEATVKAAIAVATRQGTAAGAVSATIASLVDYALRSMTMTVLKRAAAAATAFSIALGAGLLAHGSPRAVDPSPPGAGSTVVQPPQIAPGAAKRTPAKHAKLGRTLNLQVVSVTDNAPLAAAAVWVRVTRGKDHVSQGKTDEQGRYPISLPGDFSYFIVVTAHPGFAPIELRWLAPEIPENYTLALEHGVPIGGTVRDDQGRPIAGARVLLKVNAPTPRGRPNAYVSTGAEVAAAITDAEGRWRSEALPASTGPGVRLDVELAHPDHVTVEQLISAEQARALTSVQVMEPGVSLAGTVLSPDGGPVAEATVVVVQQHRVGMLTRVKTDQNGRFHTGRFLDLKFSETMLTVQAQGFASAVRRVKITPTTPPQVVQLAPRRPLRGHVVDAQGRTVAGAVVSSTQGLGNGPLDWEAETDENGRFEWPDAPAFGTILLDAFKPPFSQAMGRGVEAGSGEVTIALHRPQHLHGTVTDAETGHPIQRFVLVPGWGPDRPGSRPEWLRGEPSATTFAGGKFDLKDGLFPDQGLRRSIRIEADGYRPRDRNHRLRMTSPTSPTSRSRRGTTPTARRPKGGPLSARSVSTPSLSIPTAPFGSKTYPPAATRSCSRSTGAPAATIRAGSPSLGLM